MEQEQNKPVSPSGLVKKLCEVVAAVDRVRKSGHNDSRNYDYATEADLVDAVRGELARRHIFIFPNVVSSTRTPLYVTRSGMQMFVTDCTMEWTFVDGETGETHTSIMHGCGSDDQDKGLYKAITGCEKYFIKNAFLIPTGDDPEKEKGSKEAQNTVAQRKIADYAKTSAASVQNRLIEFYPMKIGAVDCICFADSQCLAWMMDNGLKDLTVWASASKVRYMIRENLDAFTALAKRLAVTVKEISAPGTAESNAAATARSAVDAKVPQSEQKTFKRNGKEGSFLVVNWNGVKAACFDTGLWGELQLAQDNGRPVELVLEAGKKGPIVVGIKDWEKVDGKWRAPIQRDKEADAPPFDEHAYHATDEDIAF